MIKQIFFWLVLLFYSFANGMTIGSDTCVDRFNNQIDLANGDRIGGFASLQGGIKFGSAYLVILYYVTLLK